MVARESPGRKRQISRQGAIKKQLKGSLSFASAMAMAPVSDVIAPKREFSVSIVRQEKRIAVKNWLTTARILVADGVDAAAATEIRPQTLLLYLSPAIVSATNGAEDADTLSTSVDSKLKMERKLIWVHRLLHPCRFHCLRDPVVAFMSLQVHNWLHPL